VVVSIYTYTTSHIGDPDEEWITKTAPHKWNSTGSRSDSSGSIKSSSTYNNSVIVPSYQKDLDRRKDARRLEERHINQSSPQKRELK
jgi:hypothetical protein